MAFSLLKMSSRLSHGIFPFILKCDKIRASTADVLVELQEVFEEDFVCAGYLPDDQTSSTTN